jgi:predicted glycoside hydrolase/deacetylase ChbG (UPF0249 family)
MLIVTADDYGKSRSASTNILAAFAKGRITSTSAMVFMNDSERAAADTRTTGLEIGLHLNFTLAFDGGGVSAEVQRHQENVIGYLGRHKFAQLCFNPLLARSFSVLFRRQYEEFLRLYGQRPAFYNGHHHMHLCANVLASGLIPLGARVRRTFTFETRDRGRLNRFYRRMLDRRILRRFTTTAAFFSVVPLDDRGRLQRICRRAQVEPVELEVHPENIDEFRFLMSDDFMTLTDGTPYGGFRNLVEA